ncbi:unnamed protein product [Durusdinium trenchii]|uniref:Uncharacterized protein n=1 Tax=Durusdinium trenchii TaxID=1381693 RepID=A0ABP0KR78_9DINO
MAKSPWTSNLWRGARSCRSCEAAVRKLHSKAWAAHVRSNPVRAARKATQALKRQACCERVRSNDAKLLRAGLWYVLGASRGNCGRCLQRSLRILQKKGDIALLRMKAEVLLRLKRYVDAFQVFHTIASTPKAKEELLVSPFRIRHDTMLLERAVAHGRLDNALGQKAMSALRSVLSQMELEDAGELWWARVNELASSTKQLLQEGQYDCLTDACPYQISEGWEWEDPLNEQPWDLFAQEFATKGLFLLDDFFSGSALAELWRYSTEAPCFRSLRPGYLGAFPSDGCVHPIIRRAAESLEAHLPNIFRKHHLTRWWIFKYLPCGSSGIGIHADDAAVNVNIWLTPDSACKKGGGLEIFRSVPSRGSWTADINRVPAGSEHEAWHKALLKGGVDKITYKQNRACIFVSDRFHASEPFVFPDPSMPRVNLTLLFGDRLG